MMEKEYENVSNKIFTAGPGGYNGDGFGMGGGSAIWAILLLSMLRGGFHDSHGTHHKCASHSDAHQILNQLNENDIKEVVRAAQAALGERVKDGFDRTNERVKDIRDDVSERIRDSRECISERISDAKACLSEKLMDAKLDAKEFRIDTALNFKENRAMLRELEKAGERQTAAILARMTSDKDIEQERRIRDLENKLSNERQTHHLEHSLGVFRRECDDRDRRRDRDFDAIINSFNSRNGIGNGGIGSGNNSGNTVIDLAQTFAAAKSLVGDSKGNGNGPGQGN